MAYQEGPSYIRIGKSDRPKVHSAALNNTVPCVIHAGSHHSVCLVATGSMSSMAKSLGAQHGLTAISVPRIKPFPAELLSLLEPFKRVVVLEEHSRYGGLASAICDASVEQGLRPPLMEVLSLKQQFMDKCGSYQYALEEHGMSDRAIVRRFQVLLGAA
jgi:transketolase C-terminal domain/subunit